MTNSENSYNSSESVSRVQILTPGELPHDLTLTEKQYVIGKSQEAHIRLEGTGVLPLHATLTASAYGYVLEKLPGPGSIRLNGGLTNYGLLKQGDEIASFLVRFKEQQICE